MRAVVFSVETGLWHELGFCNDRHRAGRAASEESEAAAWGE